MSGALARVTRFELVRVFTSPRWIAAAFVWAVIAKLASDDVTNPVYYGGVESWSALDVHAVAMSNMLYLGLLLLTAFVFLCGDTVARDHENRYCHVTVPRAGDRRHWWVAKAVTILAAAIVFHIGFLGACVGYGALIGGAVGGEPSAIARAVFDESGPADMRPMFTPVDPSADMRVRQAGLALYLALAFTAITLSLAAVTIRFPSVWLPVAASLAVVIGDRILGWFIKADWYALLSPVMRLMEGVHSAAIVPAPVPWWSTVAWWSGLTLGSLWAGGRLVRRADL